MRRASTSGGCSPLRAPRAGVSASWRPLRGGPGGPADHRSPACELEVAERPAAGDAVVEVDGVRLFLDQGAVEALDDAELVVDAGNLALALPEAAGCGSG